MERGERGRARRLAGTLIWMTVAVLVPVVGLGVVGETRSVRPVAAQAEPTSTPRTLVLNPSGSKATATPRRLTTPTATATRIPTRTPTRTADEEGAGALIITEATAEATGDEPADELRFFAEDWVGGYYRGDSEWYGRPWIAVYGAFSDYPVAVITFELADEPTAPVTMAVNGLDDEGRGKNPIALEINGERVYEGPAWFEGWDGTGQGENAPWTTVTFEIPPELLVEGENEVAFFNLSPTANFSSPPYILLAEGVVTSPEEGLLVEGDQEPAIVPVGGG